MEPTTQNPNPNPIQPNIEPSPVQTPPPVTQMPQNLAETPHKSPVVKIIVTLVTLILVALAAYVALSNMSTSQPATAEQAINEPVTTPVQSEEDLLSAEIEAIADFDTTEDLSAIDAEFAQ